MPPTLEKLELGAGDMPSWGGFTHNDIVPGPHIEIVGNAATIYVPLASVSIIRAIHLLEHFPAADARKVLREWKSWLVPSGVLEMAMPNIEALATAYMRSDLSLQDALRDVFGLRPYIQEERIGDLLRTTVSPGQRPLTSDEWERVMCDIYGYGEHREDLPPNWHMWGYTPALLARYLSLAGYRNIVIRREEMSLHAWAEAGP